MMASARGTLAGATLMSEPTVVAGRDHAIVGRCLPQQLPGALDQGMGRHELWSHRHACTRPLGLCSGGSLGAWFECVFVWQPITQEGIRLCASQLRQRRAFTSSQVAKPVPAIGVGTDSLRHAFFNATSETR